MKCIEHVDIFYLKLTETLIKIRLDVSVFYMLLSLCKIIFKKHLEIFSMSTLL